MHKLLYSLTIAASLPLLHGQAMVEPSAGSWRTWVLSSGSEFRLSAPPSADASRGELQWLKNAMATAGETGAAQVRYWNAGSPPYRWIEMMNQRMRDGRMTVSPISFRTYALLSVAMYDATIAAWDSKYAHNRARPSAADPSIVPTVDVPHSPSYPSEHAVVAGAAATVLGYLFPTEAEMFQSLAEEAGRSRLYAGVQYPSDVIDGLALGRKIGARFVEYARADRTDSVWSGTIPTGPGFWTGANPGFVAAPLWKTWVLERADEFRPAPPPAYDSPERQAEFAELRAMRDARNFTSLANAYYWQTGDGVHCSFYDMLTRKLFETGLHNNPPRAARAYALMSVAQMDGMIASNDGKYAYWVNRPVQQDPTFTAAFPTPNFPSYPSNHSLLSSARAEVLAYLFPEDAEFFRAQGEDAGLSRLRAGIHFRSDHVAGSEMGRQIAAKLIALAQRDGSSATR